MDKRRRYIKRIAQKVAEVKKPVAEYYAKKHKELKILEGLEGLEGVGYMPTPFEVADFYKISYEFVEIRGEMPSYLKRELKTIYISDAYRPDSYQARLLCAHELGHYFMQEVDVAAMNDDVLNTYLEEEKIREYEANVFTILLMPQIMAGQEWENYSPKILNRKIYRKAIKKDS